MVSAMHVGGTYGSGIVSTATDILWMSVVRGMREIGGVCEMCMFSSGRRGWRGVKWMRELVLGLPILWE